MSLYNYIPIMKDIRVHSQYKEPRIACTRIKSYTPMNLKNDYMSYKDYNLMKSLSKCLYIYESYHNEFCAISICFIGHKINSKKWLV